MHEPPRNYEASNSGRLHEDAGDNIAGLYSLVATCEANGVNPIDYLRDVLIRISTHPANRIDELLPDRGKPAESA
jgi:transposase